ncbi:MAG: hypothetical protein Q9173_001695 [Seirophora scorigena]
MHDVRPVSPFWRFNVKLIPYAEDAHRHGGSQCPGGNECPGPRSPDVKAALDSLDSLDSSCRKEVRTAYIFTLQPQDIKYLLVHFQSFTTYTIPPTIYQNPPLTPKYQEIPQNSLNILVPNVHNISNTLPALMPHVEANNMGGAFRKKVTLALAHVGDQASLLDPVKNYAKEHPYEVACLVTTFAPGLVASPASGIAGFVGGTVSTQAIHPSFTPAGWRGLISFNVYGKTFKSRFPGSSVAARQLPRIAAHGPFAVLQSAGAGGYGLPIVKGAV